MLYVDVPMGERHPFEQIAPGRCYALQQHSQRRGNLDIQHLIIGSPVLKPIVDKAREVPETLLQRSVNTH